jgi:phosphohistidine swiveling domain-containing protein
MGNIPMIDRIEVPLSRLKSGVCVQVDGDRGEITYEGDLKEE